MFCMILDLKFEDESSNGICLLYHTVVLCTFARSVCFIAVKLLNIGIKSYFQYPLSINQNIWKEVRLHSGKSAYQN